MPVSRNIYVGALTLAPKPLEYFAIVPSEVGGVGSPRGGDHVWSSTLQLDRMKQSSNKSLVKVLKKEGSYNFRPYALHQRGFTQFSCSRRTRKKSSWWLRKAIPMMARSLLVSWFLTYSHPN